MRVCTSLASSETGEKIPAPFTPVPTMMGGIAMLVITVAMVGCTGPEVKKADSAMTQAPAAATASVTVAAQPAALTAPVAAVPVALPHREAINAAARELFEDRKSVV